VVPCWIKIILGRSTDGGGSGQKFFKIILFGHGTTALPVGQLLGIASSSEIISGTRPHAPSKFSSKTVRSYVDVINAQSTMATLRHPKGSFTSPRLKWTVQQFSVILSTLKLVQCSSVLGHFISDKLNFSSAKWAASWVEFNQCDVNVPLTYESFNPLG